MSRGLDNGGYCSMSGSRLSSSRPTNVNQILEVSADGEEQTVKVTEDNEVTYASVRQLVGVKEVGAMDGGTHHLLIHLQHTHELLTTISQCDAHLVVPVCH